MTEQELGELRSGEKLLRAVFGPDFFRQQASTTGQEFYPPDRDVSQFMIDTGLQETSKPSLEEQVAEVMNLLTGRERYILTERFGLGDDKHPKTLKEIAIDHGMEVRGKAYTGERIRQIEARALRKLRLLARVHPLKDYLA